jgi:predicted exporter
MTPRSPREWPRLWLGAGGLGLLLLYVIAAWRVRADITHFLPSGQPDSAVVLARQVAVGELSRTMVLLAEQSTAAPERAAAFSRDFAGALQADPVAGPAIAALEAGPAAGFEEALWQLYHPRRLGFLAADPAGVATRCSDAGLATAVAELRRQLASPMSSLLTRVAPDDPFLVTPGLFDRLGGRGDGLGLVEDRFVTGDGRAAVLFLTTTAGSSDNAAHRPFLAALRAVFATVNGRYGDTFTLQLTGTNRHSVAAEDGITADIERVSIGSTVGLLLTFLLLFTSLRLPLSWLPVLAAGFLCGSAACLVAFGEIHGMTIAFGSSLIGVSIDYAVHFYCHQALAPEPGGPRATLRRTWPGLLLGCATTVVGFIVLLVATFPGLREMALFAAAGLTASLLAAWVFLPGLVGTIGPARGSLLVVRWIDAATSLRGRWRLAYWLLLAVAALFAAIGLPRAEWNDRISDLNRPDPALTAEDRAVMQRVMKGEQRRFIVALGDTEAASLVCNDQVAAVLAAEVTAGRLDGYRSIAAVLPSPERQRAVAAAVHGDATLWPRLSRLLTEQGFVTERFHGFRDALAAPPPPPLTPDEVLAGPLAGLVRPFLLRLDDGRRAVLSYLQGIGDPADLAARVAAVPGARLLDIEGALTGAFAAYRQRMATLLGLGVLAVVALVALRYRRPKLIALAVAPALLGAAATIGTLALGGVQPTMLSLVALLMVVSMGVDYGIFLAEDEAHPGARSATQLGVVVDGLTTILGFGLLAISSQPALFGIGATAGVGVTWCLVLALACGALVAPKPTQGREAAA